jgi:hypothetical protein
MFAEEKKKRGAEGAKKIARFVLKPGEMSNRRLQRLVKSATVDIFRASVPLLTASLLHAIFFFNVSTRC